MEYRPYQQGDDPAKIDWRLFGRTDRVAVRVAHDDSSLRTMVLVDASASMAFPAATRAKWHLAAAVALGLCAVAHADGDPVGVAIAGDGDLRALPPRSRRGTVGDVLRMLSRVTPGRSAPLAPVLATLRTNRRIAIISDFLGDSGALLAVAREIVASGREVHAVHIVAHEERDPGPTGSIVTDPENAAIRRLLGATELMEYAESFGRFRQELAESWRAAGAMFQMATTGEPPERIVRRVASSVAVA
jgi:uncharacterized protein (DUF58 family)